MKFNRNSVATTWLLLVLLALLFSQNAWARAEFTPQPERRFEFALIGDTPYDALQETNLFPNMIAEINRAGVAFTVHNGDIKAGATPCTDDVFTRCFAQFQTFRAPLIFVFGDNEWCDCGKVKAQPFDPVERLEKLRAVFTQGNTSLGRRPLRLQRQSEDAHFTQFRENVRWQHGGVLFAGLNVPGDANNFGTPEFAPRQAANLAWIKEAFTIARRENLRAVMLIMQANPHFELGPTNRLRLGFNEMLNLLERETLAYGRPVVLVHGDSHYYRIDQPLMGSRSKRRIENFTRVETFGNPDVHWLHVSVDWRDPNVFTFRPRYVRGNLVQHGPPGGVDKK